jgi:hypothetical protein
VKIRSDRAVSPAAVIVVTMALILGGAGLAGAATGGAFLLGRSNTETSTATLSSSRWTPLSLSAPRNKTPLAVNRGVMVKNLNAQYLGGLSASALARAAIEEECYVSGTGDGSEAIDGGITAIRIVT